MTATTSQKRPRKTNAIESLPPEVLSILREDLQIHGMTVKITKQLDRPCYEQVDEVLSRCGGKYKTNTRVHEFLYDPSPLIRAVLESGQMPLKNPLDFFHTTPPVLERLREKLTWSATAGNIFHLLYRQEEYGRPFRILEPSAGIGHIAELLRTLFPKALLHCCEIDPFRRSILQAKGFEVVDEPDFLAYQTEDRYDLIVMNSPFSIGNEQDTYIKHIHHAFDLLEDAEESDLLAVAPPGFIFHENQPFYDFYTFVLTHGSLEALPDDAFKDAGTMIRTMLLWLGKKPLPCFRDMDEPVNGYPNGRVALAWEWMYEDTNSAKKREVLLDQMASGELIIYSDGTPANATEQALKAYCQEVARVARRSQVHIPLVGSDYDHLIALILHRFEQDYPYYMENCKARMQRERTSQLEQAVAAIQWKEQALARDKAKIIELAQTNRRRKQEIAELTAAYQALQIRLREEPEWCPPERPAPPQKHVALEALAGPRAVPSTRLMKPKRAKQEATDDPSQLALPL
jgi:hypothetical protein